MAQYSDAQKKAIYKYRTKHYKRISVDVPLEDYDSLKKAVAIEKESVSNFVKNAVKSRVEQIMEEEHVKGEDEDDV